MAYSPRMTRWTANDIPDLTGKTAIVTGANSGLGYETALELAGHGARVILACRDLKKGDGALAQIQAAHGAADVELSELDLASLRSIRAFVERFASRHDRLDILCNNAGIMAIPRRETEDGFEMQIGTNHLGHFALTGLLLPSLAAAPAARIVNVSSLAHRLGRIRFDDLQSRRSYNRWLAYGQSKLANLLFTFDLQRRLDASTHPVLAVAAHPGYASTNLQLAAPKMENSNLMGSLFALSNNIFAQSAKMGALPSLRAATDPDVQGGDYYGPRGFMEGQGLPKKVRANERARDRDTQRRFFDVSEELTGVRYTL